MSRSIFFIINYLEYLKETHKKMKCNTNKNEVPKNIGQFKVDVFVDKTNLLRKPPM